MEIGTEQIWEQYQSELRGFIRSKVKDIDTSNDILQDVFLKIHLNIGKLEQHEKIRQWVYQIARNSITDHFRKQKHFTDIDEIDIEEPSFELNSGENFAKCMNSYIKYLPEKYQEALTKVEVGNMSQLDFAKRSNISYSGAKSRVQRAKEMLKRYFLNCCEVNTDKYGNIVSLNGQSKCGVCEV